MPSERESLLCRYSYDPLDRLINCLPTTQINLQRFYIKGRLTTEIQGMAQCSIFHLETQLLAQQQRQDGAVETTLLATDQQRSVLHALDATRPHPLAYTPYGHRAPENGLLSLLGFNGEQPDPVTGHYLLGNGYRAFNPTLMRFNSPDSMSPFGKGGLNAYAYGQGDPVNRVDPTGHFSLVKPIMNFIAFITNKKTVTVHGIKLRVPTNTKLKAFITEPTEKYETQLDLFWTEEKRIDEVSNFERYIIESNTKLIADETTAAKMIKRSWPTRANKALYTELTVQIKRNRAQYKHDLDVLNSLIRETKRPPSYDEVFELPLPRYRASF
ncbi:RHS repeat-associated core domain-containing protein [Pseudomonas sp. Tri1]|uniref:RHS repeat-associated core domain-containing protein n=1 Tax=Pseudomonas sp. Tri1 TaxID=2823875 RepID=UPI001B32A001|nr:RHS repeat-associated core domain-containing protein [Pseudomonas sp. Tri1]